MDHEPNIDPLYGYFEAESLLHRLIDQDDLPAIQAIVDASPYFADTIRSYERSVMSARSAKFGYAPIVSYSTSVDMFDYLFQLAYDTDTVAEKIAVLEHVDSTQLNILSRSFESLCVDGVNTSRLNLVEHISDLYTRTGATSKIRYLLTSVYSFYEHIRTYYLSQNNICTCLRIFDRMLQMIDRTAATAATAAATAATAAVASFETECIFDLYRMMVGDAGQVENQLLFQMIVRLFESKVAIRALSQYPSLPMMLIRDLTIRTRHELTVLETICRIHNTHNIVSENVFDNTIVVYRQIVHHIFRARVLSDDRNIVDAYMLIIDQLLIQLRNFDSTDPLENLFGELLDTVSHFPEIIEQYSTTIAIRLIRKMLLVGIGPEPTIHIRCQRMIVNLEQYLDSHLRFDPETSTMIQTLPENIVRRTRNRQSFHLMVIAQLNEFKVVSTTSLMSKQ